MTKGGSAERPTAMDSSSEAETKGGSAERPTAMDSSSEAETNPL
jgi:hypothetical protein